MEQDIFINNNSAFKTGFSGDRRFFKGFLAKIELVFMLYPDRFADDETKVVYLITQLYGSAMNWAASLIENRDPCLNNYEAFVGRLKAMFGNNDATFVANQKLRTIKQKRLGDIRNYILEFNKYADESSWNEEAKMDAFIAGLNDQIATKILEMFPGPQSLYALQTIAARLDSRLSTRRQFFNPQNHSNNNNNNRRTPPKGNLKFNIHSSLSKEEKDRRRKENLCMYCDSSEHSLNNCPLRNKFKSSSSNVHISNPEPTTIPRPRISDLPNVKLPIYEFSIKANNSKTKTKILLDSGSQLNLIDVYFVKEYNIPYSTQSDFPRVSGIGGKQQILGKTLPVSIQYENHICKIQFYVVDFPSYCAILGTEWLFTHNPTIDFTSNKLFFKSNHCIANCLVIPSSFTASICTEEYNSNKNEEHNETNNNIQKILPAKLLPFRCI